MGITFTLTATGGSSGLKAQTSFTDKPAANSISARTDHCPRQSLQRWRLAERKLERQPGALLEGDSVPYRAVLWA